MAFSKYDLDAIKSKLSLSREIEKKTKVINIIFVIYLYIWKF